MNAVEKHRGRILWASLISAAVAWGVCVYIGYQIDHHAYDNVLLDELLADMYYADNPVNCPPCDEGETYEWFYVEPPADIHLPEDENLFTAKQEGGHIMGP